MSKIIDQCPLCKGDFMYDPSQDEHLIREVVVNDCGDAQPMFVCQDCAEKDKDTL